MNQPNNMGNDHRNAFNLTIIGVFGQVGFLTLFIIFLALLGGLWLDRMFDSKPLFTIILMIASVPVSLVLMYKIVMWATSRIKSTEKKTPILQEDLDRD